MKALAHTRTQHEVMELLSRDGIEVTLLQQPVVLFEDESGYLHSEPRCWGASTIVRTDVADLELLADPPRCECRGWRGTMHARMLDEAGWMYAQLEAPVGSSGEDIGRWLHVAAQPLRDADLVEIHAAVQRRAAQALRELRGVVGPRAAFEALAAQAVRVSVNSQEAPLLRQWAQAMMLENSSDRRRYLDEMFSVALQEQLDASVVRDVMLSCRLGYGTIAVMMWTACSEVVEHRGRWFGRALVPALVLDGLKERSWADPQWVELQESDTDEMCRIAAKLCESSMGQCDLPRAIELARAVVARPGLERQ